MSNTNLRTQSSSVLQNHTVSSCSTSKVQEKTQLSRIKCMNSLRAIQSQLKFLIETLQDFANMPIFKRTFSQDLDLLENHLTKQIISQTDCKTTLTKLRTTFENAFSSEIKALDLVVIHNTCSEKEESNLETASSKSVKECRLNSKTKDDMQSSTRCQKQNKIPGIVRSLSFHTFKFFQKRRKRHSASILIQETFMSFFDSRCLYFPQNNTSLSVYQLQKQLYIDDFQEDGTMTAFCDGKQPGFQSSS
ncbi:hypothetical protein Tco_1135517 [Tanacetum coccineum]